MWMTYNQAEKDVVGGKTSTQRTTAKYCNNAHDVNCTAIHIHTVLQLQRILTDRQTDRQTTGNTKSPYKLDCTGYSALPLPPRQMR